MPRGDFSSRGVAAGRESKSPVHYLDRAMGVLKTWGISGRTGRGLRLFLLRIRGRSLVGLLRRFFIITGCPGLSLRGRRF